MSASRELSWLDGLRPPLCCVAAAFARAGPARPNFTVAPTCNESGMTVRSTNRRGVAFFPRLWAGASDASRPESAGRAPAEPGSHCEPEAGARRGTTRRDPARIVAKPRIRRSGDRAPPQDPAATIRPGDRALAAHPGPPPAGPGPPVARARRAARRSLRALRGTRPLTPIRVDPRPAGDGGHGFIGACAQCGGPRCRGTRDPVARGLSPPWPTDPLAVTCCAVTSSAANGRRVASA